MAFTVDIDVPTKKDAGSGIRKAQRKRLEQAMDKGFAFSQEVVPQDRGAGGGLMGSGFEPTWVNEETIVWGYRANHALPMEYGTVPFHPPIQPLLEWSERKTGDKSLGFYVALHKIPTEGIDAQPYARPGAEATKKWLRSRGFGKYLEDEL